MNTPRHGLLWMGAVVIAAGSWAGCARQRAHAEPEPPPLSAPPPPSRLLPPLEAGPIQAATPPPPAETAPPPAPARRRTESARPPDNARQEPKPTDVPKADVPAEGQRPPDETPRPAEPAAVLQLAPAAESDTSEQTIRKQLQRAGSDLSHVDYVALNADAKSQYDTAKRFMVLADQAIKDRNFVFARTLADKAAVIAGVLSSR